MSPLLFIISFTAAAIIFLLFGIFVLLLNPKKSLNISFFLVSLFLALSCITGLTVQLESIYNSPVLLRLHLIIGPASVDFMMYALLMFSIALTSLIKIRWYTWLIPAILPIYLTLRLIFADFITDITLENGLVQFHSFNDGIITEMNNYLILYLLFIVAILVIWRRRSRVKRKKRQAGIILISILITLILMMTDTYFLFHVFEVFEYKTPGVTSFYFGFWFFGIGYAILKYRLANMNTIQLNKDIFANLEESVIMVSSDFITMFANRNIHDILGLSCNIVGSPLSSLIEEYFLLQKELKLLSESANASIAIRVHFLDEEGQRIPVSLKAKIIRDEEKELLGYLLTAVQVKNDLHLTKKYRITQREIEIIRGILEGKTNKEIGLELDITERTVKSHITNIFNKLVIDNRVQLIILLQEYDILPEQQADRISISAY